MTDIWRLALMLFYIIPTERRMELTVERTTHCLYCGDAIQSTSRRRNKRYCQQKCYDAHKVLRSKR